MNDLHFACLVEAYIADDIDDADHTLLSQAVANDPLRAEQFRQQVRVSMLVIGAIGPDRSDERLASIQHAITLKRPSQILRIWGGVQKRTRAAKQSRFTSRRRTALVLVFAGTLAALLTVVLLIPFTPARGPEPKLVQPAQPTPTTPAWQDDRGERYAFGAQITAHQRMVLHGPQREVLLADIGAVLTLPDLVFPLRLHAGRLDLTSAYHHTTANIAIETPHLRLGLIANAADALPSDDDAGLPSTQFSTTVANDRTSVAVERGRIRVTARNHDVRELAAGAILHADNEGFHLPSHDPITISPTQWQLTIPPKTGHGQAALTADPRDPRRQVLRIEMSMDPSTVDLAKAWMLAEVILPPLPDGPPKAVRLRWWPIGTSPITRFNFNIVEQDHDAWAMFEDALVVTDDWVVLDIPWQARYRLHQGGDGQWSPANGHRLGIGMARSSGSFLLDQVEFIYE